jgi:hypothetical protein
MPLLGGCSSARWLNIKARVVGPRCYAFVLIFDFVMGSELNKKPVLLEAVSLHTVLLCDCRSLYETAFKKTGLYTVWIDSC